MAQLVTRLPLIADKVDDAMETSIDFVATIILMMIKTLAPVDTGGLRRSYEIDKLSPLLVLIGSNPGTGFRPDGKPINYAIFQEFGTRKMAAQPHLIPGFEKGAHIIERECIKNLKRLI